MNMAVRDGRDVYQVLQMTPLELAQQIAGTEFVPTALRNKPAAVLAAILAGREIGLEPMTALANVFIIEGRPCLSAFSVRALVQARGHRIWPDPEPTVTRATLHLQRHGESHIYTATWTMDDADRAHLKGKQNWQRWPRQMLLARATGDVARLGAADVLAGMPYVKEELEDGLDEGSHNSSSLVKSLNIGAPEQPAAVTATRHRRRRADPQEAPPTTNDSLPVGPEPSEAQGAPEPPPLAPDPPPPANEPPGAPQEPAAALAGNAPGAGNLTLAQQIAMIASQLNIERANIIRAVTGQDSAKAVTREQAGEILQALKDIKAGTKRLSNFNNDWVVVEIRQEQAPPPTDDNDLPEATP